MTLTRFYELKWNLKLCNNDTVPRRNENGYNPAYKYDLIYKTLVHNTNVISKKADENQVIDETTWGHSGYGESGTGITGRLRNKKVSKGGQTVLMMDRDRLRIRAYMHRSKIYNELYKDEKHGWTANGPFELKQMADKLLEMCDDIPDTGVKKLFRKRPCITADNFFQSDKVMEYLGEKWLGGIMTAARNCLPRDIKSEYLHKAKTAPGSKQAKIARYINPIVAVKNSASGYQQVHVSFQSTSSCNISTVNALNEVSNFLELRERGRGENKRYWVIEMNHARHLYLSTSNGIDVLDHILKNAHIYYRSWKYWHAAKNHAIAIVVASAYDIYKECCEGGLDPQWKIDNPVEFWDFRKLLSEQAIKYSPKHHIYAGDENMRAATVVPLKDRPVGSKTTTAEGRINRTSLLQLIEGESTRGCGDLDKLCIHIKSVVKLPKGRKCYYCGKMTYNACGTCKGSDGKPVPLHISSHKSIGAELCFFRWHNDHEIGLAKADTRINPSIKRKRDYIEPTAAEREANKQYIKQQKERMRGRR
jgi:hypothetical protein